MRLPDYPPVVVIPSVVQPEVGIMSFARNRVRKERKRWRKQRYFPAKNLNGCSDKIVSFPEMRKVERKVYYRIQRASKKKLKLRQRSRLKILHNLHTHSLCN